jgi:hypothetical protein
MDSIRFHTVSIGSVVVSVLISVYSEPPAHFGSVGNGSLGEPGREALLQRVSTLASLILVRARETAHLKVVSPAGG